MSFWTWSGCGSKGPVGHGFWTMPLLLISAELMYGPRSRSEKTLTEPRGIPLRLKATAIRPVGQ